MRDTVEPSELLELACTAARMAGELLLARARESGPGDVASKSTPTDLVSEADVASQRAIYELLQERRPHDGFVGEEEHLAQPGTSGLDWVVDPLDGTVNFVFGIPQWSVSVAVRDARDTLAGVVYDPNRDELFAATGDGRARLVGPGDERELDATGGSLATSAEAGAGDVLSQALIATGLAYDANVRRAQARVLERLLPRVRDIRRFGSAALDLAWTAAGRYDGYYERSVHEWDIAAGVLVCERAGLRAHELPEHEHLPPGILVARPGLDEQLLELVSGP